jgi:hypothetical protein
MKIRLVRLLPQHLSTRDDDSAREAPTGPQHLPIRNFRLLTPWDRGRPL